MMNNSDIKKISKLNEIREICINGGNIIEYLTNKHSEATSALDEEISYDLRAGEDVIAYKKSSEARDRVVDKIHQEIFEYLVEGCSLCECGCGEGLNLTLLSKYNDVNAHMIGVDISWSRLMIAQEFSKENGAEISFVMGDIFSLPIKTNGIDIVYTMQGIYGLGGHEKELIQELYRISKNYLILIEPCYELADKKARERMDKLGYVKGLRNVANELGLNIIKYELFGEDENPMNPSAVMVIEKKSSTNRVLTNNIDSFLCDPITKDDISRVDENIYFAENSLLSYPIVRGIPCLTLKNAIITSKMKEL